MEWVKENVDGMSLSCVCQSPIEFPKVTDRKHNNSFFFLNNEEGT